MGLCGCVMWRKRTSENLVKTTRARSVIKGPMQCACLCARLGSTEPQPRSAWPIWPKTSADISSGNENNKPEPPELPEKMVKRQRSDQNQGRNCSIADGASVERVTLRLASDAANMLRTKAAEKGMSVNEFMRRAIGTEIYILEQIASGGRVIVERPDKPPVELHLR